MSAEKRVAALRLYQGSEGYIYKEERYSINMPREESATHATFYEVIRSLSIMVVLGFVALLILNLVTGGPVHWAISVVGCLGSIGLAGAVLLSKPYLHRRGIQ